MKIVKKTEYKCDICEEIYPTKKQCAECEEVNWIWENDLWIQFRAKIFTIKAEANFVCPMIRTTPDQRCTAAWLAWKEDK